MGKFWLLGDFYEMKDKTMEISIEVVRGRKMKGKKKEVGIFWRFFEEQAWKITDA